MMLGVGLALMSSLAWGGSDFLGGVLSRRHSVVAILLVAETVGLAVALAAALSFAGGPPDLSSLLPAMIAGLAAFGGLAAFYRGLAVGAMSIVAPISATGAVIPVVVGLASGNRPATVQIVGIVFAVIGAVLAARDSDESEQATGRRGVLLALVAALGFGSFYIGIDAASQDASFLWATAATRFLGLPATAAVALALKTGPGQLRGDLRLVCLVGLLDVVANGLFAAATTVGLLSLVGVLGALYPVVTVLLAAVILQERVSSAQYVGVGLALAGVALIAVGR